VAFLIAALLVLYIFRLLFGRKIRSDAAKKGPRRLDVVDVFDLDRERQLVIVRRDNTEHLLLIGGPNDLLVEGSIARAEVVPARAPAEARAQAPATAWPPGPQGEPAPGPIPKPAAPAPLNLPPDLFAPAPSKPPEPTPAPPLAGPTAAPPRPAAPPPAPPPRPGAPPRPATPPSGKEKTLGAGYVLK
jgi:hypothetical protein